MNIAFSTAASALRANMTRFDASAGRIAGGQADLADEAVEQIVARQGFDASARVLQASLDMEKKSLELWA